MTSIVRIVQPGEIIDEATLNDPNVRVRTIYEPRPDQTTVNGIVIRPEEPTTTPESGTQSEPLEA